MTVVDTSAIYALLDSRDEAHQRVVEWFEASDPEFVTTPLVVAEVDHLAGARLGRNAQTAWRRDLEAGAYEVEWWGTAARDAVSVAEQYSELGVSLTDGSLVALAARQQTVEIATLDERHFRVIHPLEWGEAFRLLPADA